jgi:hypothetical protein
MTVVPKTIFDLPEVDRLWLIHTVGSAIAQGTLENLAECGKDDLLLMFPDTAESLLAALMVVVQIVCTAETEDDETAVLLELYHWNPDDLHNMPTSLEDYWKAVLENNFDGYEHYEVPALLRVMYDQIAWYKSQG